MKKKLAGLTKEHEALFNFVENNKQISTEKEKQKVQSKAIQLSLTTTSLFGGKKNLCVCVLFVFFFSLYRC